MDREPQYVYVVVAWDSDTERMTDANVITRMEKAQQVFEDLKLIYGGANVAMFSREVDSIHMGAAISLSDVVNGLYPE